MTERSFWKGRRVFITGHTGFKGSWLSLWLAHQGAVLRGFALDPATSPNLFATAKVGSRMEDIRGDIRTPRALDAAIGNFKPEIVFHMAAQPLVRDGYRDPVGTYETNAIGTVRVFEAVRLTSSVKAVVCVTTDKCYENKEWLWGYRETDPLGGYDPYSSSKACAELITSAYRQSYFPTEKYAEHGCAIASARAGNVIGGGDWSTDRLIPDLIRGFEGNDSVLIRNPRRYVRGSMFSSRCRVTYGLRSFYQVSKPCDMQQRSILVRVMMTRSPSPGSQIQSSVCGMAVRPGDLMSGPSHMRRAI